MTRRKTSRITTAAMYASHSAAKWRVHSPPPLTPARAIGVLWMMTTPRPTEFSLRSFEWEAIAHMNYRKVANELARILAPLDQPLDQQHSKTVRRITDYMLKKPSSWVAKILAFGLLPKLLSGIRHRHPGARLEYALRFLD